MSKDGFFFTIYAVLMVAAWVCLFATVCAAILNSPIVIYTCFGISVFGASALIVNRYFGPAP